jgi:hypothetical protein
VQVLGERRILEQSAEATGGGAGVAAVFPRVLVQGRGPAVVRVRPCARCCGHMLLVLPWSLLHVEDLWWSLLEWPRRGFLTFAAQKAHAVVAIAKVVGGAASTEPADPVEDNAWAVPADAGGGRGHGGGGRGHNGGGRGSNWRDDRQNDYRGREELS